MTTYRQAGVNTEQAHHWTQMIQQAAAVTRRQEWTDDIGGFSSGMTLPSHYRQPVIFSCCDGVGTKLLLAETDEDWFHLGIDLVAMSANDLVVCGAEPMAFLDYIAVGKLMPSRLKPLLDGIIHGCQRSGCALIGGETAEMPEAYQAHQCDVAGFCWGVAEKSQILGAAKVQPGMLLTAIASSGPHANGFSLIRKLKQQNNWSWQAPPSTDFCSESNDTTLKSWFMRPTHLYAPTVMALHRRGSLAAAAHITGGGLWENLCRSIPKNMQPSFQPWSWPTPFKWLQQQAKLTAEQMQQVFNCGIGFVLIHEAAWQQEVLDQCQQDGLQAFPLGQINPL